MITTVVENTSITDQLGSEHGLSLYIETNGHKLLFDVGASHLFLDNAQKLGIDIAQMEFLIISHGHYDHGGGLGMFLQENKAAQVFAHYLAFHDYYALRPNGDWEFVGLDKHLKKHKQIKLTADEMIVCGGVELFAGVAHKSPLPSSNNNLYMGKIEDMNLQKDNFAHEQNLIIREDGLSLLVTGCAHNGIVNILEHFYQMKGYMPDYVIGGLHLYNRTAKESEDPKIIDSLGAYLLSTKAKYYTCHCTGKEPYQRLKSIMGERIDYISTGSKVMIGSSKQ